MKIAMIGAGGIGQTHIENIRRIPGAQITDICDPSPRAKAVADELNAAWFTDDADMLESTQAQVVLVCTPTFLHADQIRRVLSSGRHCISEKPLCFTSQEARELYALAEEKGVQLLVAHVLLFWEECVALAQMVREQPYGKLLDLNMLRLSEAPAWVEGSWLFDKQKSGLLPFDLHIHDLYYLINLLGKPAIGKVQHGGRADVPYDEFLRICYDYPGTTVCIEASWYNAPIPFTAQYRAYFERALVEYDGKVIRVYEKGQPVRVISSEAQNVIETKINVSPTNAYFNELEHFLHCIETGALSDRVVAEEVIATIETAEAIQRLLG